MIHPDRIRDLNDRPVREGRYVLYWMQASQRVDFNHALEYAVRQANELGLPLVVLFCLTPAFPEANLRHYQFMLQGIAEVADNLRERGIRLVLRLGQPVEVVTKMAAQAAAVVVDCGYLRTQRQWRDAVAVELTCHCVQVESDVVVPVDSTSDKEEYAARTIRPKIHRVMFDYLRPLSLTRLKHTSSDMEFTGLDPADVQANLAVLSIDHSTRPVDAFVGGASQARRLLDDFIAHRLDQYDGMRNDPSLDWVSNMSPYLHFGQISPIEIALQIINTGSPSVDAYIEQLIVRRELSMNFVRFNTKYDSFACLPEWTRKTLAAHAHDAREYDYSLDELEHARTHDPYWNAAQMEMVTTGKMHNYMRMYWGKKVIEWSASPEDAFAALVYLNNRYELDGRDPNSFAGIAWCFGKHDRPWKERSIFGTVRYMNAAGLERKFDMDAYVNKIERRLN